MTVALILFLAAFLSQVIVLAGPTIRRSHADDDDTSGSVAGSSRRIGFAAWRRPVVTATVVGGAIRLVWVIVATRNPPFITDPAEYLRISVEMTHGISPRFGGVGGPSAYWPPGYPAILSPFVAIADRTGWFSVAFAAALVNAAAGTLSIALTGRLAGLWFGPRASRWAAWLVALCPALVFFTSTAHSDTVFIALMLGFLVLVGRPTGEETWWYWARVGLLLGVACLVRIPAIAVAVAPVLALRGQHVSWPSTLRSSAIVAGGLAVVLVPWLIRNGTQVGVWTPVSTNNASAVCYGQNDLAKASWSESARSQEMQIQCFGESPYADPRLIPIYLANGDESVARLDADQRAKLRRIDEGKWYRDKMGDAERWARSHPVESASLSARKAWVIWRSEGPAVDSARNYSEPGWAGRWQEPLGAIANLWFWGVTGLALVGLALVPACRRATVVWVPVVLLSLSIVIGVAEAHYRYPANPLLAVLAAGTIVGIGSRREVEGAVA